MNLIRWVFSQLAALLSSHRSHFDMPLPRALPATKIRAPLWLFLNTT